MGKIKEDSDEDLLQHYANCVKTYYGSHGHGKSHRNEMLMKHYETEIKSRNLPVPTRDEAFAVGQFNGDGSV